MIHNPIIKGCNPDPSMLRLGEDYYIATSTFEWNPGLALYHSRDLQNWELINYALNKPTQLNLTGLSTAMGIWAPCLTYCDRRRKFYLIYSFVYNIQGQYFDLDNFIVESNAIAGPWSNPTYVNSTGFDPSLFHEDGRQWIVNLVWENRTGYEHPGYITLQEWDADLKCLIGMPKIISRGGTDRGCLEAPHLYKRGDYYYLMTAEGGTGYGHSVVISRSRNINGPFEPDPKGVVLTSQPNDFNERGIDDCYKFHQYNPDAELQKAGHGSLVETHTGELYIVHLCARPFLPELRCMLGREVAIQKCYETPDGWIRMVTGDNLARLTTESPSFKKSPENTIDYQPNTVFCSAILPIEFQTYRIPATEKWLSFAAGKGLGLRGQGSLFTTRDKSLIARRIQSFNCEASTTMSFSPENIHQSAGLVVYYSAINFYYLRVYNSESLGGKTLGIMLSDLGNKQELKESRVRLPENASIALRVTIVHKKLQFWYSFDKKEWIKVGGVLNTTILSDEYGGQKFTGTFVGIFCQDLYTKCNISYFENFSYQDL